MKFFNKIWKKNFVDQQMIYILSFIEKLHWSKKQTYYFCTSFKYYILENNSTKYQKCRFQNFSKIYILLLFLIIYIFYYFFYLKIISKKIYVICS